MKTVVKQLFRDMNIPGKKYFPGDVVEFPDERANELIKKGLIEKWVASKHGKPIDDASGEGEGVDKSTEE